MLHGIAVGLILSIFTVIKIILFLGVQLLLTEVFVNIIIDFSKFIIVINILEFFMKFEIHFYQFVVFSMNWIRFI